MTFEYFKKTGEIRGRNGEWDGDEGFFFHYDADYADLKEALAIIVNEAYFENELNRDNLIKFIEDFDLVDMLAEHFEDELKEWFEDEALESLG